MGSIGIEFHTIGDTATAGSEVTVTLNKESGGNPGDSLCTLSAPDSFSGSGVQTFGAPSTNPCPKLDADTEYFVVVSRANANTHTISLTSTPSSGQNGLAGWTIANERHRKPSSGWTTVAATAHKIEVKGSVLSIPSLVKNTGQTGNSAGKALTSTTPKWAQAFTAGPSASGYTLGSIRISFHTVADTDTAGGELTVTLNEADGSDPGAELCTLIHPSGFSSSGLHLFRAPHSGPCPLLSSGTTYYVVIERANDNTDDILLNSTDADAEDMGGADGWSIADEGSHFTSESWALDSSASLQVEVKGIDNNNVATGAPSIQGILQKDETLTADVVGIIDADGLTGVSYNYQWLADGADISGATSDEYKLTANEVGKAISLRVTFSDDVGNSESLTSAETGSVVASGADRKLVWLGTHDGSEVR